MMQFSRIRQIGGRGGNPPLDGSVFHAREAVHAVNDLWRGT
jgi:hypothetical protein